MTKMEIGAPDDSMLYDYSFDMMKVAELKAQLKARHLPISGVRSELIARLQEAVAAAKDSVDEDDDDDDDDDEVDANSSSEIPSQVSLFADPQLSDELHDEEILHDPDSSTKHKEEPLSPLPTSIPASVIKPSSNETKASKTPLKPLKRTTTTIPSNGAVSSEKKVCLNRVSSVSSEPLDTELLDKKSIHIPITLESSDSNTKKSVSLIKTMTSQEKLALRAKRFNITSTDSKLKVTGKMTSSLTTKSNITPITFDSVPDMEKLKKRAERFGVVSTVLKKIEESDRVKQRLQRFSSSSGTVSGSKDEDAKRKSRMQRFGAV